MYTRTVVSLLKYVLLCYCSALLLSVFTHHHHHAVLPCTLINMHNEAACILNVCPKCICECCIWKINQQEDNSPLHAREWAVLPSHAEPCVALWHLILELLNCVLACYISMDCEERGIYVATGQVSHLLLAYVIKSYKKSRQVASDSQSGQTMSLPCSCQGAIVFSMRWENSPLPLLGMENCPGDFIFQMQHSQFKEVDTAETCR